MSCFLVNAAVNPVAHICILCICLLCFLQDNKLENAFGPQRHQFVALVAKELHRDMPWFHSRIDRDDADRIMTNSVHKDGKFL